MFSERFRLAKQVAGLSSVEIAREAGIELATLRSYSSGARRCPDVVAAKLTRVLGVSEDFFDRRGLDGLAEGTASYRKLSRTSAAVKQRTEALALLGADDLFGELERDFVLPDADVPCVDETSPEGAALLVRSSWGLGDRAIPSLLSLLESKGVRILSVPADCSAIDAFSFWRDGHPYILLTNEKSAERRRFDLAHELGHLVMHADCGPLDTKEKEREANAFAAAFLMPASRVHAQKLEDATLRQVLRAKTYWQVSAMAMVRRLYDLDLITEWRYRSHNKDLAVRGFRSAEPDSVLVPERSSLLNSIIYSNQGGIGFAQFAQAAGLNRSNAAQLVAGLVLVTVTEENRERIDLYSRRDTGDVPVRELHAI